MSVDVVMRLVEAVLDDLKLGRGVLNYRLGAWLVQVVENLKNVVENRSIDAVKVDSKPEVVIFDQLIGLQELLKWDLMIPILINCRCSANTIENQRDWCSEKNCCYNCKRFCVFLLTCGGLEMVDGRNLVAIMLKRQSVGVLMWL